MGRQHITTLRKGGDYYHYQSTDPNIAKKLKKEMGWEYVIINGIRTIWIFSKEFPSYFYAIKKLKNLCGVKKVQRCPDTDELYATTPMIKK
ncbi:hypothetical protein ACFL4B_01475 [Candidatus Neomarinimicrobiota bacterium]